MKFDFETAVHEALAKSIEGGVVDKIVADNVNRAVTQAFADQFSSYSPFTKAVKEAVAGAFEFNPASFDIQRYHLLVRKIVQDLLEHIERNQEKITTAEQENDSYRREIDGLERLAKERGLAAKPECKHERLNMDGICHDCGADRRGI